MKCGFWVAVAIVLVNVLSIVFEVYSLLNAGANTNWQLTLIGAILGLVFGALLHVFDHWFEHHPTGRLLYWVLFFATWSTLGILSYFLSGAAGRLYFSFFVLAFVGGMLVYRRHSYGRSSGDDRCGSLGGDGGRLC